MEVTVLAIQRDERFSPNSVDKDLAILLAVCDELKSRLCLADDIPVVSEKSFISEPRRADIILSMARSEEALTLLSRFEDEGSKVFNSSEGVRNCRRSVLAQLMKANHIPMAHEEGNDGFWLKRNDTSAQEKADIVFCRTRNELDIVCQQFAERGITDWVMSAHIPGDVIKFYGVGCRDFRFLYPGDTGMSKFGLEAYNGAPHHYAFDHEALANEVFRLSQLAQVPVYGGDAIVDKKGRFYIIDFNDWPSFSAFRQTMASAIAIEIMEQSELLYKSE
jgi:hypothetical protein